MNQKHCKSDITDLIKCNNGELSGHITNDPITGLPKLYWFIHIDLELDGQSEDMQTFSILIEYAEINIPKTSTWLDINQYQFIGNDEGSFYDGTHNQTSYIKLIFLERFDDIFKVSLTTKFSLDRSNDILSKGEHVIEIEAKIKFTSITIDRDMVRDRDNFFSPIFLRQFLENYIS